MIGVIVLGYRYWNKDKQNGIKKQRVATEDNDIESGSDDNQGIEGDTTDHLNSEDTESLHL